MARSARICIPGVPQHIIQPGNNRQVCFASDEDFSVYAHWLGEYSIKYCVAVHVWVLMTNHVHLLVTPETKDGVSKLLQMLGRHYVRYFNYTYKRTGTLWEGRFKSCLIDAENYLLVCQRYIELNPVRAGMVSAPDDCKWSSYQANGLGRNVEMWRPHIIYQNLGSTIEERTTAYRQLFIGHLESNMLTQIRTASNSGLVLGNDRFKQEIETLTGRRITPLKRRPKPKAIADE